VARRAREVVNVFSSGCTPATTDMFASRDVTQTPRCVAPSLCLSLYTTVVGNGITATTVEWFR
jgi:hypothetical protein